LVGEVSTSIRKYMFEMGYIIAVSLVGQLPGLGPIKKAAELMMKFRDDTEKKISNARLRRDVDKLLKNVESIMKSLAISDAVSGTRYNASKESKTVSQPVEQDSSLTKTVSLPVEPVSPPAEPLSTPVEPVSSPQATTGVGGGRKKRRTKGKKNKTKRRTKGKRKKTKRRRN